MEYGPYETLRVSRPHDGILHVELNRPKQLNAMNRQFWSECRELFLAVAGDLDTRVVIISAVGKHFSAGLDVKEAFGAGGKKPDEASAGSKKSSERPRLDTGRVGFHIRQDVLRTQESVTAIESVPQPVIVVGHGAVVGGGIDLMCTCCIRYASRDAWFTIKEVDVGLAADVGTLQRLPKIIGNEGIVRELAYTSRKFDAEEAYKIGFLTKLFDSRDDAMQAAFEMAGRIASKSPLAVVGTKRMITHQRDHSVLDGLDYIATWNMAALQSQDTRIAATASLQKKTATFSKL